MDRLVWNHISSFIVWDSNDNGSQLGPKDVRCANSPYCNECRKFEKDLKASDTFLQQQLMLKNFNSHIKQHEEGVIDATGRPHQ